MYPVEDWSFFLCVFVVRFALSNSRKIYSERAVSKGIINQMEGVAYLLSGNLFWKMKLFCVGKEIFFLDMGAISVFTEFKGTTFPIDFLNLFTCLHFSIRV